MEPTKSITIHIPYVLAASRGAKEAVQASIEAVLLEGSEVWMRGDSIRVWPPAGKSGTLHFNAPADLLEWLDSDDERDCTFTLEGIPAHWLRGAVGQAVRVAA